MCVCVEGETPRCVACVRSTKGATSKGHKVFVKEDSRSRMMRQAKQDKKSRKERFRMLCATIAFRRSFAFPLRQAKMSKFIYPLFPSRSSHS